MIWWSCRSMFLLPHVSEKRQKSFSGNYSSHSDHFWNAKTRGHISQKPTITCAWVQGWGLLDNEDLLITVCCMLSPGCSITPLVCFGGLLSSLWYPWFKSALQIWPPQWHLHWSLCLHWGSQVKLTHTSSISTCFLSDLCRCACSNEKKSGSSSASPPLRPVYTQ